MHYKYSKKVGALQEKQSDSRPISSSGSGSGSVARSRTHRPQQQAAIAQNTELNEYHEAGRSSQSIIAPTHAPMSGEFRRRLQAPLKTTGLDPNNRSGGASMFHYTVDDGQQVLMTSKNGSTQEIVGPTRVWRLGRRITPMQHYIAHPGEFLIVRFRNGEQKHLTGPTDLWADPRRHVSVEKEEVLPIATKEAVVAYSKNDQQQLEQRIVHGPATFVPQPGEWLHTFSWHGSEQDNAGGYHKIPNALVFQKLWLLPDQMYHDVTDVRTADDAVLTIRLMIFFELINIERMLDSTHDPIGDFVNAASSDIVEFVGHHDFNAFKRNTDKLNSLVTYKQLNQRAEQTGYRVNKVVYRGYGAPDNLQEMHDKAIESRTSLALDKATEQQAQELEDYKLDRELTRSTKQRVEQVARQDAELGMLRKQEQAHLETELARREFSRQQEKADTESKQLLEVSQRASSCEHFATLKSMGVELTQYLTQGRADKIVEFRGNSQHTNPHVHFPVIDDSNDTA